MNCNNANLDLNDFQNGYKTEPVLLKDYNHGNACDIREENVESRMRMFEKASPCKSTFDNSLRGDHENNMFSQVFFSKENVQIIQNGLRAKIHELTGKVIPPQNTNNLMIIMRTLFDQYGNYYKTGMKEEIQRLNQIVLNYAIPQIRSSLESYLYYLKDQESLPVPMSQPIQTDRDFKQLEMKPF